MAPYNLFIETTYYNITQHVKHVLFLILIELTPTLSSTLSTNWDLSKNLHLVLSFKNQKNYTKYGIYVTLVTFWMTFLMNNWEILSWMMDEFMHWPKPYLLLSATFDEILSWKIEIWIKKSLGKWQYLQHYKSITPPPRLQEMTNSIGLTFNVGDNIPWFTINTEQDN